MRNYLSPGKAIERNSDADRIVSANKLYRLVIQDDGNLVIYKEEATAVWATHTENSDAKRAIMQLDGNFVLYGVNDRVLWSSGTAGREHSTLILTDDGNLVIQQEIWRRA